MIKGRELYYASIYVSAIEGDEVREVLLDKAASGYLRRSLSQSIELRTFPKLRFYWDPTPENAARVEFLLDQLKAERTAEEVEDEDKAQPSEE